MATGTLASLNIAIGADSAQISGDMGKIRSTVKDAVGGIKREAQTAMASVTTEIRGIGGGMRGAQQATAATMRGLELAGVKGSSAIAGIGNAITGLLTGGFTPWGAAIGVAVGALGGLLGAQSDVSAETDKATEAFQRQAEVLHKIREETAGMKLEERAVKAGVGTQQLSDTDAIAAARSERDRLRLALSGRHPSNVLNADDRLNVEPTELEKRLLDPRDKGFGAAQFEAEMRIDALDEQIRTLKDRIASAADLAQTKASAKSSFTAGVAIKESIVIVPVWDEDAAKRAADQAEKLADELQRAADLRRDKEESVAEDLDRAEQAAAASRWAFGQEALKAREQLAFDLAQIDRTDVERAVEDERRRWAEVLADARLGAAERVEIERLLAAKIAQIRAAARAASDDVGSTAGTTSTVSTVTASSAETMLQNLGDMKNAVGQLEVAAARGLIGGVAGALMSITTGSERAGAAFRKLASSMVMDIGRIVLEAQIARLVMSVLGIDPLPTAPAKPPAAFASSGGDYESSGAGQIIGGAHGGTWRVGGFGGLDSKLVRMKLSPGELVKVSDGANSGRGRGAGGDFNGTLIVRPPAVIADEVAAKASREAKAEIVATGTAKPGRRGMRPRD